MLLNKKISPELSEDWERDRLELKRLSELHDGKGGAFELTPEENGLLFIGYARGWFTSKQRCEHSGD
jgi:hypothetical protein